MKALTELQVKNMTHIGRHADGMVKGLHLWVKSPKHKYWILRYSLNGKRKDMSIGTYPKKSVKEARKEAIDAKRVVENGRDPVKDKKSAIAANIELEQKKLTFKNFALECVEEKASEWRNKKHAEQWVYTLKEFAFPLIGNKPLDSITTNDILGILKPIWLTKTNTAVRLRGRLEWILGSATTQGYRDGLNPASWRGHLMTVLPSPRKVAKTKHHPSLPYHQIGEFVAKLGQMDCLSALALEFTILTAARTEETLAAKRNEIKDELWTVPAERMKAGKEQRVPLVPRALEILRIANHMDPDSEYLFSRNGRRLCNMAMLALVKGMGYKITVHGFRATFRTWSEEETMHHDSLAKKALAHTIKDKVDEAYNRGDLLKKRLKLMEDWAKFCERTTKNNLHNIKVA